MPLSKTEAIEFLRDCQRTHREWAEYFEKNPEEEKAMCGSGEWDDAATHRQLVKKYEQVIEYINQN